MMLLDQALVWLNAVPTRYWIAAWAAFGVTGLLAFLPARSGNSRGWTQWQASLFAGGVLLTLAAFRWPSWFYPTELNPDEAQTIAGALTLAKFPIYWKYVDGTTHGPLCEYFLLFAHWLGAPFSYVSARVVATLLLGGSVLGLWGTLHCLIPPRTARVAILPVLGFWSFVSWDDFVHCSSELPGIFLLALGGWLAAVVYVAPKPNPRQLCWSFLAGCALGAVPFAKLQSVPQGLALGLLALVMYWRREGDWTPGDRRKVIGTLVAGALAPAVSPVYS